MGNLNRSRSTYNGGGGGVGTGSSGPNSVIGGVSAADAGGRPLSSGGYPDDGARRMPSGQDAIAIENMRRLRAQLSSNSGRQSTNLSGTRSYVNAFLGGVM